MTFPFTSAQQRTFRTVFGGAAITVLTLVSLYAIEAFPGRFATDQALAWGCSISASSSSLEPGAAATLTWSSSADVTYVTIDQIPGTQFERSGTTTVYPNETTTYVAHTHVGWTSDTLSCQVTVQRGTTPPPPPPEDTCDDVTLSVDDDTFTWSGQPWMDCYEATFCDGTGTGEVGGCWVGGASIDLGKRIKSVSASGGSCHKEVTQTCPPPVEEPEWPACPFTPSADTVVVEFDGKGLIANGSLADATSNMYPVSLAAGTYTVRSASWDGYSWRASDVVQPYEQWFVRFMNGANSVATTRATTDLDDGVIESLKVDTLETALSIPGGATALYAVHAKYPYTERNSVQPVCLAITKHAVVPQAPTCSMTASPASITEGASSTISWTTTHVASASFTGGIAATAVNGSAVVSPTADTTYTGTFVGTDGSSITCSATVDVTEKPPVYSPWCSLSASPATIVRGSSTVLAWNSADVTSGTLSGFGSIDLTGTRSVSPATTTTYSASFAGKDGSTKTCTALVTVTEPSTEPAPVCTLSVSPGSVRRAGSATLTWTSDGATSASINGIGSVDLDGSKSVTVYNNETYVGTFTAANGKSVTCSAAVSVTTSGGGGSCLNCDDNNTSHTTHKTTSNDEEPSPKITLSKIITKTGNYITLDQVPYTGFEAGPFMTMFFWLGVLALSAAIAYVLTKYQPVARIRAALATIQTNERGVVVAEPMVPAPRTRALPSVHHAAPTLAVMPAALPVADDGAAIIEDLAHRDNILLSPEATRILMSAIAESGRATEEFLGDLFAQAKASYPREDGWILISKERVDSLIARSGEKRPAAPAPVVAAPAPVQTERPVRVATPKVSELRDAAHPVVEVPQPRAAAPVAAQTGGAQPNGDALVRFVEGLVNVEQQKTYDILRQLTAKGVAPEVFIARVVRELDEIYKHRIEGNHKPNAALAAATATWSNADFETVLGMLVECIDYSYSSPRIGTKVALAKVFEYFGKK